MGRADVLDLGQKSQFLNLVLLLTPVYQLLSQVLAETGNFQQKSHVVNFRVFPDADNMFSRMIYVFIIMIFNLLLKHKNNSFILFIYNLYLLFLIKNHYFNNFRNIPLDFINFDELSGSDTQICLRRAQA